jgi:hypothetical protein
MDPIQNSILRFTDISNDLINSIPTYDATILHKSSTISYSDNEIKEIKLRHSLKNEKKHTNHKIKSENAGNTENNLFEWINTTFPIKIHYNEIDSFNSESGKFYDFKLNQSYKCEVYYHTVLPKYLVIEDTFSQAKYNIIEELSKSHKILIFTNQTNHWKSILNTKNKIITKYTSKNISERIALVDYSSYNTTISNFIRNYNWTTIILDNYCPNKFPKFESKIQTQNFTSKIGIIFVSKINRDNYLPLFQKVMNKNFSENYNLHQYFLSHLIRRISPIIPIVERIPLQFSHLENHLYKYQPTFENCLHSNIYKTQSISGNHPTTLSKDPCFICLEDNINNDIAILKCGHISCLDCIYQYIFPKPTTSSTHSTQNLKCPICQKLFVYNDLEIISKSPIATQSAKIMYLNSIPKKESLQTLVYLSEENYHLRDMIVGIECYKNFDEIKKDNWKELKQLIILEMDRINDPILLEGLMKLYKIYPKLKIKLLYIQNTVDNEFLCSSII